MARKTSKKPLKVVRQELDYLPVQQPDTVALYDMDKEVLEGVIDADGFREGLVKLKSKFLYEIQEWADRNGLEADVRVYFTLKEKTEKI